LDLKSRQPLTLNSEFSEVLNQLEHTSDNFFITGKAGTGKSTLLQLFRGTSRKRMAILAPTGIAALNVRGQTIHSFFGFAPRMLDKSEIVRRKNYTLYQKLETLVIDEISMVRADMLDNIDWFLRVNRGIDEPFGGVQMIFFGDLFQLPPVVSTEFEKRYFRENYESQYFFGAKTISKIDLRIIELNQVFRQDEKLFIRLLDNIRQNAIDEDDLETINERFQSLPEDRKFFVYLCARNATADSINSTAIEKLTTPKHVFNAKKDGEFPLNLHPNDEILVLKEGAQVMFIKNDPLKNFVNGTIGTIKSIFEDEIMVEILDENGNEKTIKVEPQLWENVRYRNDETDPKAIKSDVIGSYQHYPLKLSWAITIHKSQGKTFDRVIIDLGGGAFESGQTYVALSRCRRLEGIYLIKPITPRDIIVDPVVVEFYDNMRRW
jgi:ATP-dependent DNA helicase PIF1